VLGGTTDGAFRLPGCNTTLILAKTIAIVIVGTTSGRNKPWISHAGLKSVGFVVHDPIGSCSIHPPKGALYCCNANVKELYDVSAGESSYMSHVNVGQHGTTWDNMGQRGTTWDNMGQRGTTWDNVGQRGTTWDNMGQHGTMGWQMGFWWGDLAPNSWFGEATKLSIEQAKYYCLSNTKQKPTCVLSYWRKRKHPCLKIYAFQRSIMSLGFCEGFYIISLCLVN